MCRLKLFQRIWLQLQTPNVRAAYKSKRCKKNIIVQQPLGTFNSFITITYKEADVQHSPQYSLALAKKLIKRFIGMHPGKKVYYFIATEIENSYGQMYCHQHVLTSLTVEEIISICGKNNYVENGYILDPELIHKISINYGNVHVERVTQTRTDYKKLASYILKYYVDLYLKYYKTGKALPFSHNLPQVKNKEVKTHSSILKQSGNRVERSIYQRLIIDSRYYIHSSMFRQIQLQIRSFIRYEHHPRLIKLTSGRSPPCFLTISYLKPRDQQFSIVEYPISVRSRPDSLLLEYALYSSRSQSQLFKLVDSYFK